MLPFMNKSIMSRISNLRGLSLILVLVSLLFVFGCEAEDETSDNTTYEAACSEGDISLSNCTCSKEVQNSNGKLHSQPCDTDADCLYGVCHSSPAIANFKFCTKNPYCGPTTECSSDNGNGVTFKAQLFNQNSYPDETDYNFCTQVCGSVGDCPPGYTDCEVVSGVVKTCTAK